MGRAIENANDGVSLTQVAGKGLALTFEALERLGELAVEAADEDASDAQRGALQEQVEVVKEELDLLLEETGFEGRRLLDGSFRGVLIEAGPHPGDAIVLSFDDVREATSRIAAVDISTRTGARDAIGTVGGAMSSVAELQAGVDASQQALRVRLERIFSYRDSSPSPLVPEAAAEEANRLATEDLRDDAAAVALQAQASSQHSGVALRLLT